MKKAFLVLVTVLMLFNTTAAFSEPRITLGIKAWQNSWKESKDDLLAGSEESDMGDSLMAGPSLTIKFNRVVFVGASYLTSVSDYESHDWSGPGSGDTMAYDRHDVDFTLGFMFGPYFGMFLGHKTMEADKTYTNPSSGISRASRGTWKLSGPGIGILGNIPLGRSAAIYGNLAFMDMEQELQDSTGTAQMIDLTGISGEAGLAVAFSETVSANVGFKAQSFEGGDVWITTYENEFTGATFGLNFTF